jgi:hypothetical protein
MMGVRMMIKIRINIFFLEGQGNRTRGHRDPAIAAYGSPSFNLYNSINVEDGCTWSLVYHRSQTLVCCIRRQISRLSATR